MKKICISAIFTVFISVMAVAQNINPIQWTYTAKKIADKTYELQITANIQNTWHLYSQKQPADAINQPTEIIFKKWFVIGYLLSLPKARGLTRTPGAD